MKTAITLYALLWATNSLATNQIEERVAYDGIEWTMRCVKAGDHYRWPYFPFEDYLKTKGLNFRSVFEAAYKKQSNIFTNSCGAVIEPWLGFSTACSRGYVAKWKIENNRLFLVEIGNMMRLYKRPNNPPMLETYPLVIFNPTWESPVFADWVTQKVLLAAREARNGIELDGYAKVIEMQIENGIVKNSTGENPLFSLSMFSSYQADRDRMLKALKPSVTAHKPLVSDREIKEFYEKATTLRRGMTPDEVEVILGKPDETSIWEPKPMNADDPWFKQVNVKSIPEFVEAQNKNRINVCVYTMRYYFYKEKKGKIDILKDICVTLHFRFDNYPDKSKRSLKDVW